MIPFPRERHIYRNGVRILKVYEGRRLPHTSWSLCKKRKKGSHPLQIMVSIHMYFGMPWVGQQILRVGKRLLKGGAILKKWNFIFFALYSFDGPYHQ